MNDNTRMNLAIVLTIVISVSLSVCFSYMLIMPREGPMGTPGLQGEGLQGLQGIQGEQGPQGESGPMGPPGDPAFSWIDFDSIDIVWELGEWDPARYQIGSVTFNITGSIWWIDITISQQPVVPAKVTVYNTNREEGFVEWSTEANFTQHRILMVGPGEYGMFVYGSNIQRIEVIVKQVIG